MGWRGLQQHVHGFPNQRPCAANDERRGQQRRQRIGLEPARHANHERRDDRSDGGKQIAEDVQVRAANVETVGVGGVQQPRRNSVGDKPRRGDAQHQGTCNRLWRVEPRDRFHDDPRRNAEQRRSVDERGEDLPAQIPEGLCRRHGLPAEPGDEERQP